MAEGNFKHFDSYPVHKILEEILEERRRQDAKWGEQNHENAFWYAILGEEFGEVGRGIFEGDEEQVEEELIHVAAVAASWVQAIRRRRDRRGSPRKR